MITSFKILYHWLLKMKQRFHLKPAQVYTYTKDYGVKNTYKLYKIMRLHLKSICAQLTTYIFELLIVIFCISLPNVFKSLPKSRTQKVLYESLRPYYSIDKGDVSRDLANVSHHYDKHRCLIIESRAQHYSEVRDIEIVMYQVLGN